MQREQKINFSEIQSLEYIKKGETRPELVQVQQYLVHYGYLSENTKYNDGCLGSETSNALENFQRFFGMEATGEINEETIRALVQPRCSMPDTPALAFATECPWADRNLTFAFGSLTTQGHLDQDEVKNACRRAFQTWSSAGVGLSFTEITAAAGSAPNFQIEWRPSNDPDFNLVGNTLAHADFPPGCSIVSAALPLPIHFDDEEHLWNIGSDTDIETVALHEIGHALGLRHSRDRDSVMAPNYQGIRRSLTIDDLNGIRSLYS